MRQDSIKSPSLISFFNKSVNIFSLYCLLLTNRQARINQSNLQNIVGKFPQQNILFISSAFHRTAGKNFTNILLLQVPLLNSFLQK